jgi:uracil-DNA glycosylase family 4
MTSAEWKRASIDMLYQEQEASLGVLRRLAADSPLVKGGGPLNAAVILVGEAPGAEEVVQLRPFVGPSGRLLDELLPLAGLTRAVCYVTNVSPWRPRSNRRPDYWEIDACRPRLLEEIRIIGAPVVITLGATALRGVTGARDARVSDCHGRFMSFGEAPQDQIFASANHPAPIQITAPPSWSYVVMPTYHPSAALQDQIAMKEIREDFARLGEFANGGIERG